MKGNLYLIPVLLGNSKPEEVLPSSLFELITRIDYYIVEDVRSARRFLKKADANTEIDKLTFFELNKHTANIEIDSFLEPARSGSDTGLMSEAGSPCVADPGSNIIYAAHRSGIKVIPLPGPSSIILALMASGLNGQKFAFHGYLPVNKVERSRMVKSLENESLTSRQSQIFMETPYRNMQMVETLTEICNPATQLCIACDITLDSEYIYTCSIAEWKRIKPDINRRPAIFILQGAGVF